MQYLVIKRVHNMSTNFERVPWLATTGCRVQLKSLDKQVVPESWKSVGTVKRIFLDRELSSMNKINLKQYRVVVDFGGEEAHVLPCVLERASIKNP